MENLDADFTTTTDLKISREARSFLLIASRWANFLAITGFIVIGQMTISTLVIMGKFGSLGFEILISLGSLVIYIFPTLYMYRFARTMRQGLEENRQNGVDESFENLKSLFKFLGIFTIVMISIYVLVFIFATVGLSTGSFRW